MKHLIWRSRERDKVWKPNLIFHLKECNCSKADPTWNTGLPDENERITEEELFLATLQDRVVPWSEKDNRRYRHR